MDVEKDIACQNENGRGQRDIYLGVSQKPNTPIQNEGFQRYIEDERVPPCNAQIIAKKRPFLRAYECLSSVVTEALPCDAA